MSEVDEGEDIPQKPIGYLFPIPFKVGVSRFSPVHQFQGFYWDPNDTATEEPTEAIESIAQAQKVGE